MPRWRSVFPTATRSVAQDGFVSLTTFLAFVKDGEGRPEAVEEANAENNAELNIIGVVKNKYLFMSRPKPTKVQAAKHPILRTWRSFRARPCFFSLLAGTAPCRRESWAAGVQAPEASRSHVRRRAMEGCSDE